MRSGFSTKDEAKLDVEGLIALEGGQLLALGPPSVERVENRFIEASITT